MKIKTAIAILSIFTIAIISCSKNKNETTDKENEIEAFELIKTEYGGCFINNPVDKEIQENGDTLYYVVNGDSLILNATLYYNCCGLLKDSVELGNNEVNIFISDTCTSDCVCYCECNFSFEYYFRHFENTHFFVYLKGLDETEYTLWRDLEYNE